MPAVLKFYGCFEKEEFNKLVLSRSQKVNVPLLFLPLLHFMKHVEGIFIRMCIFAILHIQGRGWGALRK